MLYNGPSGGGANDPYVGKNVAAGQQGSRVPPKAVEAPQRELVAVISEAGLTPTNDDLKQALKAIRGGSLFTFTDQSTAANSIVIAPATTHTALFKNLRFRIWPKFTNTLAAVAIAVGAAGTPQLSGPLTRQGGAALVPGDIVANVPIDVVYDGANFRLTSPGQAEIPRTIASNPILWVRPDGNDLTGDGSANDAGHAFATIQAAMNASIIQYATTGRTVVIQLGAVGSYAAPTAIPAGVAFQILGNTGAQASYVLSGVPASNRAGMLQVQGSTTLTLTGLRIVNGSGTVNTVAALYGGAVFLDRVTLDHAGANSGADVIAFPGGSITFNTPCYFASNSACALQSLGGSISVLSGVQLSLNGTNNYSTAVAQVLACGTLSFNSGSSITGSGVSGVRFSVYGNGVINTFGGGVNFIPGSSAGTQSTGGQYL